jgi:hypothetical protein
MAGISLGLLYRTVNLGCPLKQLRSFIQKRREKNRTGKSQNTELLSRLFAEYKVDDVIMPGAGA